MSTLSVANVQTGNATSDLTITSGNTTGPSIVLYSNNSGVAILSNSSTVLLSANATSNVLLNGAAVGGSNTSANLNLTTKVVFTGNVTPTVITANVAAWNPGTSGIFTIRVSANSTSNTSNTAYGPGYEPTIFGLTAGVNGQIITISNIGPQKIRLMNEDTITETTAGNRFNLPNNLWVYGYQSLQVIYDGTLARWRPITALGASPKFSLGYDYENTVTLRTDHKPALTKGFFSGGQSPTLQVTADRTTYSTETTAAVTGANLSQARALLAAAGNADKGFFAGGGQSGSPVFRTTADRTIYSSETTAAVSGANLSQARSELSAAGNSDKGFFSGGNNPGSVATAGRTIYSTETHAAVTGANLSQARGLLGSSGNTDKGFFAGGGNPSSPGALVATAGRTIYSTETHAAVTGANLSQARGWVTSAGNRDKGFFTGGFFSPSGFLATADRTTYSTETTSAVTGANLSQARSGVGAAGNSDKGFFAGGNNPTAQTTAGRTTYSTEVHAAVTGANLSQARNDLAAV
jgi:hypothetical protein